MRTHRLNERLGRRITGANAAEMRTVAEIFIDPDFALTTRTTCELGNIILDLLDSQNTESIDSELNYMYAHLLPDE